MVKMTAALSALAAALHFSPAGIRVEMAKKMVHPKHVEASADQRANGYASVSVRSAVRQHNQRFVPIDGHLDVLEARRQDVATSWRTQDPLKDSWVPPHALTERPFMGVVQTTKVMQSTVPHSWVLGPATPWRQVKVGRPYLPQIPNGYLGPTRGRGSAVPVPLNLGALGAYS